MVLFWNTARPSTNRILGSCLYGTKSYVRHSKSEKCSATHDGGCFSSRSDPHISLSNPGGGSRCQCRLGRNTFRRRHNPNERTSGLRSSSCDVVAATNSIPISTVRPQFCARRTVSFGKREYARIPCHVCIPYGRGQTTQCPGHAPCTKWWWDLRVV